MLATVPLLTNSPCFVNLCCFPCGVPSLAIIKAIVYSVLSPPPHWSDVPSQLRYPCIGLYIYKDYSHALMLNVPV